MKSVVKLALEFCNKDSYTIEDFFRLYEYVNTEQGFDKFGALNPVGSWMIRSFIYAICEDKFGGTYKLNPAYLGEALFTFPERTFSLESFISAFNSSQQEWFKQHKQYIGIDIDKP